ncbi:hypothetical protein AG0111_0g3754 [Alternaria gaisen]|uniref:Uncharacterized protein n=1 Tax=Alternaria gaisen TaxID=167740 RepID=A0ACB6FSS9_9PLEO|nr:hypothetical protein AG0111_0g3754 [Alternaria gaisen]
MEVTTPTSAASPNNAPSPTTQIAKDSLMVDRACMFAQGQHEKLLNLLDGKERRTLSDWLHQYWFFCFKTAKHWGKGPKRWTAELLNFDQYHSTAPSSLPATPQDVTYPSTLHNKDEPTPPSDLCRWYIHAYEEDLDYMSEDEFDPEDDLDPDDDTFWPPWSPSEQQPSLQVHLRNALEHNDFSPTPATDLPVAIPQIAKAADEERSSELLVEALGFSIMSRNIDQIQQISEQLYDKDIDPVSLHPFHLATSFLDGSKTCCDVLFMLSVIYPGAKIHAMYINEHGHTILDNLMIAIIKSHTTARPVDVDDNFRDVERFAGEEVDICGRWDADSPCVRQLYALGHTSIPPSWKHKFCNTSIQTICHCIERMFNVMPIPLLLQTPSGLYVRRCFSTDCGKKLQLSPLHSLVMTAYHLATQGRDGEDLFGILACALCLIAEGFHPSVKADLSVAALLSIDSFVECDHVELTAAELAEEIMALPAFGIWNTKIKTGWAVLTGILRRCEAAHVAWARKENHNPEEAHDYIAAPHDEDEIMGSTEPDRMLEETHFRGDCSPCFTGEKNVGTLWSSVQAEFLSYRRLNDGLGWISQYFSMESLREKLEKDEDLVVGYTEKNLLKAHCACHGFGRYPLTLLSEAIDPNLANLDVWERATYGPLMSEY